MKCDDVDNIILWVLILTAAGDLLALFSELLSQRCEKKQTKNDKRRKQK
ncbi:MAG: hypothetical protein ABFC84_15735 [Veillonellales bacterium]